MASGDTVVKVIKIQGESLSLSCPRDKMKDFDEAISLVQGTLQGLEKVEGGKTKQMILGMLHLAHELKSQRQELDFLKRDIHHWMTSFKSKANQCLEKKS